MEKEKAKGVIVSIKPAAAKAVSLYANDCGILASEAWRKLIIAGAFALVENSTKAAAEYDALAASAKGEGTLAHTLMLHQADAARAEARAASRIASMLREVYPQEASMAAPSAGTILAASEGINL